MDLAAAHAAVLAGLPVAAFDRLVAESGFTPAEVAAVADIPPTTLARRRREGRFSTEESERILRIRYVFERTNELFDGDTDAAREWLTALRPALGNVPPLQLARTDFGARMVEQLIGRLEDGVFT
jgi:putative toxin-antitoxin system antitoxin component (TIGR02293 family)